MTDEQLQVIKEQYSNMNWEDFRENVGDLSTLEIDIYNEVVITGVPVLIGEIDRLRAALQRIAKVCDQSDHIRTNNDLGYCEDIALAALEGAKNE